jgi:hypothetical protein
MMNRDDAIKKTDYNIADRDEAVERIMQRTMVDVSDAIYEAVEQCEYSCKVSFSPFDNPVWNAELLKRVAYELRCESFDVSKNGAGLLIRWTKL